MRASRRGIALAIFVGGLPRTAMAHAFAERYDLPLPLELYLAGAGLAVLISFLVSFFVVKTPGFERPLIEIPIPARARRALAVTIRCMAIALFILILATAFFGPDSPTRNVSTIFIWVIWWVGFLLFTALVIDLWGHCSPFQSIVHLSQRFAASTGEASGGSARPALGWIAVIGLLGISWLELISELGEQPRALGILILIYTGVLILAARLLGWQQVQTADPVSVLFRSVGRVAPLAITDGGLRAGWPGSALVGTRASTPHAVFILCLIAIVLFDGLSETPIWAGILDWVTTSRTLRPWLLDLRAAGVDILQFVRIVGLLTTVAASVFLYLFLVFSMYLASNRQHRIGVLFCTFAGSLLPIAIAYHLAHYVSYLALAGQLILPALSDPFGLGWNLLGTANRQIDLGVVNAEQVWWIAAAALVAGHAVSVFVAHAEALKLCTDRQDAIRSQVPMMIFMVALTSFSLWVLSQPIVA